VPPSNPVPACTRTHAPRLDPTDLCEDKGLGAKKPLLIHIRSASYLPRLAPFVDKLEIEQAMFCFDITISQYFNLTILNGPDALYCR